MKKALVILMICIGSIGIIGCQKNSDATAENDKKASVETANQDNNTSETKELTEQEKIDVAKDLVATTIKLDTSKNKLENMDLTKTEFKFLKEYDKDYYLFALKTKVENTNEGDEGSYVIAQNSYAVKKGTSDVNVVYPIDDGKKVEMMSYEDFLKRE